MFHELFTRETIRLYFDVDHCKYDDTIETVVSSIKRILTDVLRRNIDVRVLKNISKRSYHVYTDIECSYDMCKWFAEEIYRINPE